jgi:hypothetical protein
VVVLPTVPIPCEPREPIDLRDHDREAEEVGDDDREAGEPH